MQESIYNLIPQPVPMPEKEPLYRSSHAAALPPTFSTFGITGTSKPGYTNLGGSIVKPKEGHHEYKKATATMGKDGNAVPPSMVLKKKRGGGGGPCAAIPATEQVAASAGASARDPCAERACAVVSRGQLSRAAPRPAHH